MNIHFRVLLLMTALLLGLSAAQACAQTSGSQAFYCLAFGVQTFTVPNGVTSITAIAQGAHASNPDEGARGGFGGFVRGDFAVTPGQTLFIWVGCDLDGGEGTFGLGSGGKGGTSTDCGDGGWGGGGSAVTLDEGGNNPLLVAGGGGGGGGSSNAINQAGGEGGDGGLPGLNRAGMGGKGDTFGDGGQGGGTSIFSHDGGDGQSNNTPVVGGCGGGGGGGGFPGAGGGTAGGAGAAAGGGGGGGNSFMSTSHAPSSSQTGWSLLVQNGFVSISWPASPMADSDGDGIPDSLDKCPRSNRNRTVVIGSCDSGVVNGLDVDGCTINDRIAKIAADAGGTEFPRFLHGVEELTDQLTKKHLLTAKQVGRIQSCLESDISHDRR